MITVTANSDITNYTWPYTTVDTRFNELEKIFFVVGQELKSLLNKHAEYVDSYRILDKTTYLVDTESVINGNVLEGGFIDGMYDLLSSFAPNKGITSIPELQIYWSSLLREAITPTGLSEFVKFLVGNYIVTNNIDVLVADSCGTLLDRVKNIAEYINVYVYEWSNPEEVQIGQYYFYPGMLGFMESAILIGIREDLYALVDSNKLATYVYNQLEEVKENKLTPSLSIVFINVLEDWENG